MDRISGFNKLQQLRYLASDLEIWEEGYPETPIEKEEEIIEGFCSSLKCAGQEPVKIFKTTDRKLIDCPDCGSVLFWQRGIDGKFKRNAD